MAKKVKEWMLDADVCQAIDECKCHRLDTSAEASVQEWCTLSKHDCFGQKPRTKHYKPSYFDCLCLVYAGLCPKGIKPKWYLVVLEAMQ